MNPTTMLQESHDVSQTLQRKLEGLADVERAFVHVDYEQEHNVHEEHKPLYETREPRGTGSTVWERVRGVMGSTRARGGEEVEVEM
jgi:hypothetical protein